MNSGFQGYLGRRKKRPGYYFQIFRQHFQIRFCIRKGFCAIVNTRVFGENAAGFMKGFSDGESKDKHLSVFKEKFPEKSGHGRTYS